jgi:hypothetical protein
MITEQLKCMIFWVVILCSLGRSDVSEEDFASILRAEDGG